MVTRLLHQYINTYRGLSQPSWMLALVMLINRTGTMVLPFLMIYMDKKLGFSIEQTGIVLSCFGIGSLVGNILGGWLTDKFGSYHVQLYSLLLTGPLFILLSTLHTVHGLAIGMFAVAAVADIFRPANSAAITLYAKPENLTRAFSLNRMAINLGFSFGPFLGGIMASISYDLLFYGNAVGCFIAAIVFYSYFNNKKGNVKPSIQTKKEAKASQFSAYRDIPFIAFTLLCVIYFIPFCQIINVLPLFYEQKGGLNEFGLGLIMGYSAIIIVIIEMAFVHYMERKYRIFTNILIGVVLAIPSYAAYLIGTEIWMLYVGITLLSFSEILFMPFYSTVAALRANSNNKGAYMALNSLSFSIAFIITPFIATRIIGKFGYNTLWTINIALCLIAILGFMQIRKTMKAQDTIHEK